MAFRSGINSVAFNGVTVGGFLDGLNVRRASVLVVSDMRQTFSCVYALPGGPPDVNIGLLSSIVLVV